MNLTFNRTWNSELGQEVTESICASTKTDEPFVSAAGLILDTKYEFANLTYLKQLILVKAALGLIPEDLLSGIKYIAPVANGMNDYGRIAASLTGLELLEFVNVDGQIKPVKNLGLYYFDLNSIVILEDVVSTGSSIAKTAHHFPEGSIALATGFVDRREEPSVMPADISAGFGFEVFCLHESGILG